MMKLFITIVANWFQYLVEIGSAGTKPCNVKLGALIVILMKFMGKSLVEGYKLARSICLKSGNVYAIFICLRHPMPDNFSQI